MIKEEQLLWLLLLLPPLLLPEELPDTDDIILEFFIALFTRGSAKFHIFILN